MRRIPARSLVVASVVVAAAVLGAGCSSDDATSANLVPVPSADAAPTAVGGTTDGATGDPGGDTAPGASSAGSGQPAEPNEPGPSGEPGASGESGEAVDGATFDEALAVYDSFLALRAEAITRRIGLEDLDPVATDAAVAQIEQLRAANDQLIAEDSYAVLQDLAEWSNVTTIDRHDDRLLFTDCTERQFRTPGGATVVHFVTNEVTLVGVGSDLRVDDVTMVQDGVLTLAPDEFGCAPQSFRERAESTARSAVESAARLTADPAAAGTSELPAVFVGDARDSLQLALDTLVSQGLSRVADETVRYEVLGMDVNRPDFTVVVAVCRTYPSGRSYVDGDGVATVPDLPVGSSYEEWVYVQLDPSHADTAISAATDVATEVHDRGPNCSEVAIG